MLGLGALVSRFVPVPLRLPVRVAGIVSVAVGLVSVPFVLGYGRRPDDPSALPLDDGRGLLVILAIVWAAALAAGTVRTSETDAASRPDPPA